jgi:hypothetical protein
MPKRASLASAIHAMTNQPHSLTRCQQKARGFMLTSGRWMSTSSKPVTRLVDPKIQWM